jgi:hypothetical protein
LSASCTFLLTMSVVMSPWNSQWLLAGFLLWDCSYRHHGFLGIIYLFCWSPELGIHFLHFPLNPVLNYFWGENGFHLFVIFLLLHLVLYNYVLDRLLVVSVTCFLSLCLILFCLCIGFLALSIYPISVPGLGVI